jgi:hypothetical protein
MFSQLLIMGITYLSMFIVFRRATSLHKGHVFALAGQ